MNENQPGPVRAETAASHAARPVGPWGPEPVRVIVQQGGNRFLRWLPWMLLAFSLLVTLGMIGAYSSYVQSDEGIEERFFSNEVNATDKVAILEVEGVINSGEGFVKRQMDRIRKDPSVKAIVLRVNSPGGTISGSHLIYHRLKQLCKEKRVPLVVSMGALAASGGYYISMAAGINGETGFDAPATIYAEPTTTTGSIGVILPHYNIEGLMKDWKVEDDSVKSHPLKGMGSITREMTPEERAKFQAYINDSFQRFKDVVAYGRPHFANRRQDLDALATGEIFTAAQAIEGKLVDREGFIEDAVAAAIEMAGLHPDEVRVVNYEKPKPLIDLFGEPDARAASPFDLATLFDLTTPRAYYLCSWFPTVSASGD